MNFFGLAIKLNSVFCGNNSCLSSLVASSSNVTETIESTTLISSFFEIVASSLINLLLKFVYLICTFVLNVIEFLQFLVSRMLGINVAIEDYAVFDKSNPLVNMLTNETVLNTFKIVVGVSIVLIIIFTIFAIAKSEYEFAQSGDADVNSKKRIMVRSLKAFFTMGMFPLILMAGILLVNAILAGFNDILRGGENTTISGQIFIASAYSANNYRNYAEANKRIPIVINFDDPVELGQGNAYSAEELNKIYKYFQPKGAQIFDRFADNDFNSFASEVVYQNNQLINNQTYNGFERFICTREQYYVLADFVDYAIKNNVKYYVKNMKDVDIDWKYVSDAIYNKSEGTLKITYKDTNNLNNGKSYTVTYHPESAEVSSPISDAVKTISALLAIGEYKDNTFNILNRLEDSLNVVQWCTDKVYLRLSKGLRDAINRKESLANIQKAMTAVDKLILFERARLSYNNTINATLTELMEGVELPAYMMQKRVYRVSTGEFVVTEEIPVALINGKYYELEQIELKDDDGNLIVDSFKDSYYTLLSSDMPVVATSSSGEGVVDFGTTTNGVNLGKWKYEPEHTFSDITVDKKNGEFENELGTGGSIYTRYDDIVNPIIKQVSWPQKLINDLQVIYKDVNINQMITTGKWLDKLSEIYGADNTTGDFTSDIGTSLISPLGIILSELFLGEIEESDGFNLYGSLVFNTKFDSDTIKALMLSLMGEDNYFQLKAQFEYFNEMYNAFMGPVIDEIAYYENFELVNGKEASMQLYTYKAYLATIMISEQSANWFYNSAMNLLKPINFQEEIIGKDGYYKSFNELEKETKEYIKNIYNSAIKNYEELGIEPTDSAYPEYLNALKDYIDGGSDAFGGRLEIVLKSWLEKNVKEADMNGKKTELNAAYAAIFTYIENSNISSEFKERLLDAFSVYLVQSSEDNQDSFSSSKFDIELKTLMSNLAQSKTYLNELIDNSNEVDSLFKVGIKNALDTYFTSANAFISSKRAYIEENDAFKYANNSNALKVFIQNSQNSLKTYYDILSKENIFKYYGFNNIYENIIKTEKVDDKKVPWINNYNNWINLREDIMDAQNKVVELTSSSSVSEEEKAVLATINEYLTVAEQYYNYQNILDRLNRYYIVLAVNSTETQGTNISLEVVINNKHYTVGQNFTSGKFIEYVLGGKYLKDMGYSPVFVDENYEGLLSMSKGDDGKVKLSGSFSMLRQFMVELGDISSTLYQMTNLVNLSDISKDELIIGATSSDENDLAEKILLMILQNDFLQSDNILAFFDLNAADFNGMQESEQRNAIKLAAIAKVSNISTTDAYIQNNKYLNTVLSYLLLTNENSNEPLNGDYSKITLKQLRLYCMQFLCDFEAEASETETANQLRYMAVFSLACSDWLDSNKKGAINNSWTLSRRESIASLKIDKQSQATILRLAGLDNRPYEELVGAEYTIDFNLAEVDEANGDVFVICTFDEERRVFIPFMMSNKQYASYEHEPKDEDNKAWAQKYNFRSSFTEYYVTGDTNKQDAFFPVIAKGLITSDGKPTAIRERNGNIEYYRDDIKIHNVTDIGLSNYYISVDQVPVHHTAMSYLFNSFTKLVTGKTLIEHVAQKIPRVAAHSNINFCYGVEHNTLARSYGGANAISFNFDKSACPEMEFFYSLEQMNILILLIGVVALTNALFKALWGIIGRMFDITVLFVLGPAVISTITLSSATRDKDDKEKINENTNQIYTRWSQTITDKVVSVFAYAIGFNVFFIVVPILSQMTLFESNSVFASLPILKNVSVHFLNEIARLIFLVAAAYLVKRTPGIFAAITRTNNGFDEGANIYSRVKNTVATAGDFLSGRYALDKLEAAKETAVNSIPGIEAAKKVAGKVKEHSIKAGAAGAKAAALAAGLPPEAADMVGKQFEEQMREKEKKEKEYKEKKKKARETREKARSK